MLGGHADETQNMSAVVSIQKVGWGANDFTNVSMHPGKPRAHGPIQQGEAMDTGQGRTATGPIRSQSSDSGCL